MLLLIAALLAASPCETMCGLRSADVQCETLQRIERDLLDGLVKYSGEFSRADMCETLTGWTVITHKPRALDDRCHDERESVSWLGMFPEMCFYGYTHVELRAVEIGVESPQQIHTLAHELIHVIEGPLYNRNHGHCYWEERGIKWAIWSASGVWDDSSAEEFPLAYWCPPPPLAPRFPKTPVKGHPK
jgi:hypothetical protein